MYPGVGYLRVLRGEGRVSGGRYPGVYPTLSPSRSGCYFGDRHPSYYMLSCYHLCHHRRH